MTVRHRAARRSFREWLDDANAAGTVATYVLVALNLVLAIFQLVK